jgi:hypothetical protein
MSGAWGVPLNNSVGRPARISTDEARGGRGMAKRKAEAPRVTIENG